MGRKLFEIARLLPEEEVSFDLQESKGMAIQCRESRFQIRGSSPEDFPRVAKVPEGEAIPFDISVLQSMIRRVDFAPSFLHVPYSARFVTKVHADKRDHEFSRGSRPEKKPQSLTYSSPGGRSRGRPRGVRRGFNTLDSFPPRPVGNGAKR